MRVSRVNLRARHRIAIAAVILVGCAQNVSAETTGLRGEISVIDIGSPSAPDMHLLTENMTSSVKTVEVSLSGSDGCPFILSTSPWKDIRLRGHATVELQPHAWYVLSAPSGFGLRKDLSACNVLGAVEVAEADQWRPVLKLSRAASVSTKPALTPTTAGTFKIQTSVVEERFSHPRFTLERVDRYLQVQIRVQNTSQELRMVLLPSRDLTCTSGGAFSWLAAADEAISGLSSGPVELPPGAWTVFSQRIGGVGTAESCTASFEVAQVLREPNTAAQVVRKVETVKMRLIATARAEY